jgi:four helix bundle protein
MEKRFDLEERTQRFSNNVRVFVKNVPKKFENIEDLKQLLKSSGSVAANYIEANESESKRDFRHRVKICRKEAKESRFWLTSLLLEDGALKEERQRLQQEAHELERIFGAILRNTS